MKLRARVDKLERQKRPVEFIVVETQADADRVDASGDNVVVVITGVYASVAAHAETAETHCQDVCSSAAHGRLPDQ